MKLAPRLFMRYACVVLLLSLRSFVVGVEHDYIIHSLDVQTQFPDEALFKMAKLKIDPFFDPTKVIAGTLAKPYQFPYQVAIFLYGPRGSIFFCGGSVITRKFVLTAAHCMLEKPKQIEIVLGTEKLDKSNPNEVRRSAAKYILHRKFDPHVLRHDICLIELNEEITFNRAIQPIRLPNPSKIDKNYQGFIGVLSGFGKTRNGGDLSKKLMYIELQVLDLDHCNAYFGDGLVRNTQICTTGMGHRGACQGDSGGPLVIDNELVGIVSFGGAHCSVGMPTVYTRVNSYLKWIFYYIHQVD